MISQDVVDLSLYVTRLGTPASLSDAERKQLYLRAECQLDMSSYDLVESQVVAAAGISYGFEVLQLRSIWAQAATTNERSIRTLRSVGLTQISEPRESYLKADTVHLTFRITYEMWTDRHHLDQSECT